MSIPQIGMLDVAGLNGFADETIQVTETSTALSPTVFNPTNAQSAAMAIVKIEGSNCRWWAGRDSTGAVLDPQPESGFLAQETDPPIQLNTYNQILQFRIRRVANGVTKLNVLYYR